VRLARLGALPPPERRRRSDVVVTVGIVLALTVAATLLWVTSPAAGTDSAPAEAPVPVPSPASDLPAAFVEAWRAPSGATASPVVAGPVVVTGEGGAVEGREATTGEVRWSYTRDVPLCTVGSGFPDVDRGVGRALALYRNDEWCSELTSLRPDTGGRDRARNPDVRPGTRLLETGSLVTATGADYLEVFRSDLVETVEYGDVPTPRQVGRQPRPDCGSTGFAATDGRLAVLQACPGERTDRLTVVDPDGAEADKPQEQFSVQLPVAGATLVAVSEDRVAVALPDPPRLELRDRQGAPAESVDLDVPPADLARQPPGGVATVITDGDRTYWWTGSHTVALDALDLTPRWTLPDTLGPAVSYAGTLLVPVPDGLAVVDASTGRVVGRRPVDRGAADTPVVPAVLGQVLVEQRGPELVALRPA
jgi:hypothetical protein